MVENVEIKTTRFECRKIIMIISVENKFIFDRNNLPSTLKLISLAS